MSFLDRFRTSKPAQQPRGGSGRGHTDGFIVPEETNMELVGARGLAVYDRMYRTDPDVRRVVSMAINPIIKGAWAVEPHGGENAEDKDRECAEATEWALMEFMRPGLKAHLAQALPVGVRSGFAPFEQVWGRTQWNGRDIIAPKTLGLRLPRTITNFNQDGEELTSLTQFLPDWGKGSVSLPAEDLVYYRFGAEGDNWEGTSMLRPVFKPWHFKDFLERISGIKAEREAIGVVVVYPPRNATDDQLDKMEEVCKNLRTAEQAYVMAPGPKAETLGPQDSGQGWTIEILTTKGSGSSQGASEILQFLEYQADKISAGFVAEFMRLGQGTGAVGARATADVQSDPFDDVVGVIAEIASTALNESLVERFVALNFEVDEPPKLRLIEADAESLTELAEFVSKLVTAKALNPDHELEDALRARGKLPPADPEERRKQDEMRDAGREQLLNPPDPTQPPTPPKPGDPTPPTPPAKPTPPAPKPDPEEVTDPEREPRWWEEVMELEVLDTAMSSARERFEAAGGEPARALARTLTDVALKGGAAPAKPPADLTSALAGQLEALHRTGQSTVRAELDTQRGGPAPAAATDSDIPELRRRAQLAAHSIASRIWQRISQTVLSRPGDRAAAQSAGEQEAAAALRAEAQLHASSAVNLGRQSEADAHSDEIAGARYTSILDTNRCTACASADDDVLRPLNDPVRLVHRPPNIDCQGGGRCRCMEFYELEDEASGFGGSPPPDPRQAPVQPSMRPVSSHFQIKGGSAETRAVVEDQIAAIEKVHRLPENMPVIPIAIREMQAGTIGQSRWAFDAATDQLTDEAITLSRQMLANDPPISATVHEIGHQLDLHGFGAGNQPLEDLRNKLYYSGTAAMAEWRAAIANSDAYRELQIHGTEYEQRTVELLARSYEQYIALRADSQILKAKIELLRSASRPFTYWQDSDFTRIAEAFDKLLATRGLRS